MIIRSTVLSRADRSRAWCAALAVVLGMGPALDSRAAEALSTILSASDPVSGAPRVASSTVPAALEVLPMSGHAPRGAASIGQPQPPSSPHSFDIPAQPLADALEKYGAMSGRPVFFDSSLAAGRTSAPVHGVLQPEAALRALLEGTGLTADRVPGRQVDAFVLKLAQAPVPVPVTPATSRTVYRTYDGLIQQRILQAFCGNPRTEPGSYRTAIRFGVDETGRIVGARLLHSTGDADRDAAIVATLGKVLLDVPPPDMAQPVTMVIVPHTETSGPECRTLH